MYAVSDAYKVAVADSHRKSKMRAVLTIGSTVINLDDNDILKDSVYVTNQCTNGNEYEYECVYSAECGITIKSAVDRYSLYDAENNPAAGDNLNIAVCIIAMFTITNTFFVLKVIINEVSVFYVPNGQALIAWFFF